MRVRGRGGGTSGLGSGGLRAGGLGSGGRDWPPLGSPTAPAEGPGSVPRTLSTFTTRRWWRPCRRAPRTETKVRVRAEPESRLLLPGARWAQTSPFLTLVPAPEEKEEGKESDRDSEFIDIKGACRPLPQPRAPPCWPRTHRSWARGARLWGDPFPGLPQGESWDPLPESGPGSATC